MYLEPKDPVSQLMLVAFPSYVGRKFEVESCEQLTLVGAYWSGGSRTEYRALNLTTKEVSSADSGIQNPFRVPKAPVVDMVPCVAIVAHRIFQGKDFGLRMYVHPSNLVGLIPEQVSVGPNVLAVLKATRCYKAGYGGDKNYRQRHSGLDLDTWNRAKDEAIALGLLDPRGALTIKGKNLAKDA